ncbi:LppP/LprE lipoprotein [Corynebacterium mustelae]|uniref:LppP/LprE lipoprotein n=1 Tax=Corynebacterium mustelae TaxID=571915 RepID=A0A0G3GXA1_9CORY|nr:LppP/LprE family lipoprotein [Corynebacterium mustelae]AKK05140.1 LppP/LprE lipoprotein [Corynebacterium mustelae]
MAIRAFFRPASYVTISLALVLGGCGTPQTTPPAADQAASTSVAEPALASAAPRTSPATDDCDPHGFGVIDTALGPYLTGTPLSVTDSNGAPQVIDVALEADHFDPCANISWVVLQGTQRYADGTPAPLPGPFSTVVFFHFDQLVTEADYVAAASVADVVVDGDVAEVTYTGFATEEPAQTITYQRSGVYLIQETEWDIYLRPLNAQFIQA